MEAGHRHDPPSDLGALGRGAAQDVEDAVQDPPVVNPLGTATARGQKRVNHRPFLVCQIKTLGQAPFQELESQMPASLKALNWFQTLDWLN